jgi:methylisocitrate lyase
MTKTERLRACLENPEILLLPGVYDCVGAKLVEQLGFDVVFTSGYGISGSVLGRPDFGFLTATEMLNSVGHIADSVSLPVVADIDTGYGNPLNVVRTVSDVVNAGVSGVILEDQEWPKKCGHFEGKQIIPMEEHVEKIHAAVDARDKSGLVIIGRTDARAVHGLDEAIRRGRAYYEAGADVVFIEAPQSVEELETIAAAFPDAPLFANMIKGGKTPLLSAAELHEMGFKIVVFPLAGLFAAVEAMSRVFRYLKENGTTRGYERTIEFSDFELIVDVPAYRALEKKYSLQSDE